MVAKVSTTNKESGKSSLTNTNSSNKIMEDELLQQEDIFIVALGASIEDEFTLKQFFSNLPNKFDYAVIIITNYQSRIEKTDINMLIQHEIKIVTIENNMEIQPNVIYVVPYDKHFAIRKNIFNLLEPYTTARKWPIDFGFKVIAENFRQRVIGIILSGNGTDGALGLKAIRSEGGLSIIIDPSSTPFNKMAVHARENVQIDFILRATDIPNKVAEYCSSHQIKNNFEEKMPDVLQRIFYLLRSHVGHDFSSYKLNTICRRIEKRMNVYQIDDINIYARYLQLHPRETEILFKELLIGVTNFFRNPLAFDYLKYEIIPNLIKDKPSNFCLRIWVPGCSTGEEVYSLAIIIKELFGELKVQHEVQIFGTDLDDTAIEIARNGVYPADIEVDVSPERLKRFFEREENSYRIRKELRKIIIFAPQNIIKDPPFTKLDIISCRNLLIYLNNFLQKKIFPIFHYSLNPNGILFLGTSESIGSFNELFDILNKKWKVFRRKGENNLTQRNMDFSLLPPLYNTLDITNKDKQLRIKDSNFGRLVEKHLLSHYAPTCILIDDKNTIVYIHGKSGKFLEPAEGEVTLNIIEMARPLIRMKLSGAIRKAVSEGKEVVYKTIQISDDIPQIVNLIVRPILDARSAKKLLLVIFEPVVHLEPVSNLGKKNHPPVRELRKRLLELELDLKHTRENLQCTIEELETSNEELKSSNEELQSTNEELQSTNEEIETSKEELQSLNEEFSTVNAELEHRIEQLSDANDDIKNLLDCTEIATIFLDTEMRVKRFTTRATDLFNFITSDIGRPINHLVSNLDYDNLIEDAQIVLKTLKAKAVEIKNKSGSWYCLRIVPYKTLTGIINGVLITILNIDKQKQAEQELALLTNMSGEKDEYIEALENTIFEPLLILNHKNEIISLNKPFADMFDIHIETGEQKTITDILNFKCDEINDFAEFLKKFDTETQAINNFEINCNLKNKSSKKLLVNSKKLFRKLSNYPLYILVFKDIT